MRKEPLPDILAFFARCCRCQPEALHGKSCAFIIRAEQPKREGKAGAAGCFILCKLESEPKTGAEGRGLRAAVGLRRYEWLSGFDIDWEYPACERQGNPADPDGDEGCCVFGAEAEDRENFILLLAELRAAMDSAFGPGRKSLTACASGAPVEPERPTWDTLTQEDLLELLQTPGWHSAYDARAGGAYLVYDGPDNPFDRWFLSVETARSLGQKLDLIRNAELAGIIVWEASLDTKNHSFAAQLRDTLLR